MIRFIKLKTISFAHSFTGEKYTGMIMGFKEKIKAPGKSRKVKKGKERAGEKIF